MCAVVSAAMCGVNGNTEVHVCVYYRQYFCRERVTRGGVEAKSELLCLLWTNSVW